MKRLNFLILTVIILMMTACGTNEPELNSVSSDSTESTLREMSIVATAAGWDAPESVPAGWTRVTLSNESNGLRQAAFLRLDDDKSMDDVFAAIEAGMEGPAEWMTPFGGVSGVLPGDSTAVSLNLAAGQYIVIDPVPEADGVPGMAKGYFMPLVVESSEAITEAPAADFSVNLLDYAFDVEYEAFTAGRHTLQVSNSGPQEPHELVIVKLDEGATVQDFLDAMAPDAAGGAPPGQIVAGTAAFVEGADNYLEVEFEEGATYGIICFTPSIINGGQPHFMLGMIGQFTVQN